MESLNINVNVSELIGKTIKSILVSNDDSISFICVDGSEYLMNHFQDCCEQVVIEDIAGDLDDLIGSEILMASAEESEHKNAVNEDGDRLYNGDYEVGTWTFYKFATIKGAVTIRWGGYSNGAYSESVDFAMTRRPKLQDLMA